MIALSVTPPLFSFLNTFKPPCNESVDVRINCIDESRLYCRDEVRVMMRAILKLKGPQARSQIFKGVPIFRMLLLKIILSDLFAASTCVNLLLTLS
jgi:hypothetical protein